MTSKTQFEEKKKKKKTSNLLLASLSYTQTLSLSLEAMVSDNRCLNRVVTGVGVGGALGASIGELEREERERGSGK